MTVDLKKTIKIKPQMIYETGNAFRVYERP